ncbi:MAG: T9SS type B sorting domain-containing protein, partial [Bacteroidales bacterium]|nr:T9SS type B sorting domain-containing protein [Bacteroidales bacterium]
QQTYLDASVGVPDFFTPNSDGYNDEWRISGLYIYPNVVITVYDRYGKVLFEHKGSDFSWDGRYHGQHLPSDTYWYVIQLDGSVPPIKGSVTIKR